MLTLNIPYLFMQKLLMDLSLIHFVIWDGSGTFTANEVSGAYKTQDQYLTTEWKRYTYTFKTSAGAGAGRAGWHPPTGGFGQVFWGAQLEKQNKATPYIHTYDSKPIRDASQLKDNVGVLNSQETVVLEEIGRAHV